MGKRYELASRWWGSISKDEQLEFDVMPQSTDVKSLLVGECKWSENDNTEHLFKAITEKAQKIALAKNKNIVSVLFLKSNKKSGENIFFRSRYWS